MRSTETCKVTVLGTAVLTDILEEWPYRLKHVNIKNKVVITKFCVRSFLVVVAGSVVQISNTSAQICTVSYGWNKQSLLEVSAVLYKVALCRRYFGSSWEEVRYASDRRDTLWIMGTAKMLYHRLSVRVH